MSFIDTLLIKHPGPRRRKRRIQLVFEFKINVDNCIKSAVFVVQVEDKGTQFCVQLKN